jgi:hypothetical protein
MSAKKPIQSTVPLSGNLCGTSPSGPPCSAGSSVEKRRVVKAGLTRYKMFFEVVITKILKMISTGFQLLIFSSKKNLKKKKKN